MKKVNRASIASEKRRRVRVRREARLSKMEEYAKLNAWGGAIYYKAWDLAAILGYGGDWRPFWVMATRYVLERWPEAKLTSGMRSAGGWKGVSEAYPHVFQEPGDVYELDDWDQMGRKRMIEVPNVQVRAAETEWEQTYGLRAMTPEATIEVDLDPTPSRESPAE